MSIKGIVRYYATPAYGGVEVEEDENWDTEDLESLAKAIDVELVKRASKAFCFIPLQRISRSDFESLYPKANEVEESGK